MKYAIWVVGLASGHPVGAWLKECDVDARDGFGSASFVSDVKEAMLFDDLTACLEYWRRTSTVRPLRDDWKPNRPLTAFTIEPRKVP